MNRLVSPVFTSLLAVISVHAMANAPIWDTQAPKADGTGAYALVNADPVESNRVTVEGVALAGWNELLDPSVMYTAFLQDTTSDKGGIQAWSGKFYYGNLWRPAEYIPFAAGDRLRITGFLADNRGKVLINDRHSSAPVMRFTVQIVDHPGMPDAQLIPSVGSCNSFDVTRATGGERYQGRWVMLHGLEFNPPQGGSITWKPDGTIPVKDATGEINLYLASQGAFGTTAPSYSKFAVAAIFDQEDLQSPFIDTYRLWVKSPSFVAESLDTCQEAANSSQSPVCIVNKRVARTTATGFVLVDASGELEVLSDRRPAVGSYLGVMGTVTDSKLSANVVQQPNPLTSLVLDPSISSWLGSKADRSFNVTLSGPDGLFDNYTAVSLSDGAIPLGTVPQAELKVELTARPFLKRTLQITPAGGSQNLTITLVPGDADGNGQINLFDYVQLDINFGHSDVNSDVNGDGMVNLFDYVVLDTNFGAQADL